MLVKQAIYILYLLIFVFSISILIYSKKNENRIVSKYIIILSVIYVLYLSFNVMVPDILDLDIGLDILIFYGISIVSIVLFIISIIVTTIRLKKQQTADKLIKYRVGFIFCVLFPIFILGFSYFRETNYINNSKLILVCSEGDEFNEEYYAYAISDNYSEKISIGTDFRGINMEKHLSNRFYKLNYTLRTDKIEINKDKIIIIRDNEIIYEMNLTNNIYSCDVDEVFYKN